MASPKTCNSSSRPSIQQMYETVQPYTNNTSQVSSLVEWLYYKVGGVNKIKNPYLLGKGSFGAVFVLPGNPCIVLKVVQFKGNGGLAEKTSFRNEVKKALVGSQYYDNFIKNYSVPILGSVETTNYGVYFMPNLTWYGDNVVPLEEWVRKHPNMSDPMYNTIFKQLRTALMAMYKSGLVHGDLHTGNIHVVFSNSGDITKVLIGDLGTAIGIEDAKSNSRRSAVTKLKQSTTIKNALNAAHEVWQSENNAAGNFPKGTGIWMKGNQSQQPYRSNRNMLKKINPAFAGLGIGRYEFMTENGKRIIGPVSEGDTTYGKLMALPNNTVNVNLIRSRVMERARHLFLNKAYDEGNVNPVSIDALINHLKSVLDSNSSVPNKSIIPQILKITRDDLDALKGYMKIKQQEVVAEFKTKGNAREKVLNPNKNINRIVKDADGRLDPNSLKLLKRFIEGLAQQTHQEGSLKSSEIIATFVRTYLQSGIQNGGTLPNANTLITRMNPDMSQNAKKSLIRILNKEFIQPLRNLQQKTKNLVNLTYTKNRKGAKRRVKKLIPQKINNLYNNNRKGTRTRVMNSIKQNIDIDSTNFFSHVKLFNTNQMVPLLKQYLLTKATVHYDSYNK